MAYASTVEEVDDVTYEESRQTTIVVTETGVLDATHEVQIPVPMIGEIVSMTAVLTAGGGTATSIDTQIGESTGTANVLDNGTSAATVTDRANRRYVALANVLYMRSRANGTTTLAGSIVTTIVVQHGH